jgi:hypothetical protein
MAGDTLNRPLFQHRENAKFGGLKSFYNYLRGYGKQGELFKYGPDVPVTSIDDLGQTRTINTQTVDPKKRFDVETNIYGQPIDESFYKYQEPKIKPPPIIETTPSRTETDLFGNTRTVGGETKINWKNLYNQPFTNFGTIKQRWSNMPKDQRKKVVRNVLATGTTYTMLPDWMKDTPAAQEVKKEIDQKEVTPTLEEQGLPTPALSYEEATTFGPEGDPSIIMAGMEEYAEISDKEIEQKKKELKEEREILNPEPVDPGGRMEEYADLSKQERGNVDDMGVGEGETMFDLINAYLGSDTEVDAKGIEETKAELKALMGDGDDKMMNTMMLMQLGLSLMSGETRKSGLAGFMEVAGKAGNEILPIAMQNLQNKSKMEKELALAAYDIVREERAAKTARISDIQDFYIKEMIKKEFEGNEPKGTLRTVMKKNVVTLPDGQEFTTWTTIDQVFDKGERAAYYMDMSRTGNKEMGVMPGDIRLSSDRSDALASAGNDPYQGDLTPSQRGEHLALASVFEAALPDALNIQMNPTYGLYSGNLSTGTAGGLEKFLRTVTRETKQLADNLGVNWFNEYYENYGKASMAALDVQMTKGMIFSGGVANTASNYSTGSKDLYVGEGMGPDGTMIQGEWATDTYVKNLINNPTLDIAEQMQNRLGFLAARLKQPTGRLLADTIRRSIEEVKMLGTGAGDPIQVSHRLHQFTKDLYQQYVKHSMLGGTHITESWAVDPGIYGKDRITIKDYQEGYYNFIGGSENSPNLPIDMSWVQIDGRIKSSAPAYSGTADDSIDVKGPVNFFQIYEKYNPGGNQTFGGKSYEGAQ